MCDFIRHYLRTKIARIMPSIQNIAIFASGTGTNAKAIIDYFKNNREVAVGLIVTNRHDAGVLDIANEAGVEAVVIGKQELMDEEMILALLDAYKINFIVLAGWLVLIPSYLVDQFKGRILNIHPALLPKFGGKGMYGKHVHRAVVDAGERQSGITIHHVNEVYDEGGIVAQFKVELLPTDGAEEVERKVRLLELKNYAPVIEKVIANLDNKGR